MGNSARSGQLSPIARMFGGMFFRRRFNNRGEVVIPFMESVAEDQRPAVESFVTNSGATTEDLSGYGTFNDFLSGYKPKAPEPAAGGTTWKENLSGDMRGNPLLQKFEDTPEGLGKAFGSHIELEKLLGHDKVPIPKSAEDIEGWNRFSKAMGIPDKAEDYGLADAEIPDALKGLTFDKNKFAEVAHTFKLTPDQTNGLWGVYTEMAKETYGKHLETNVNNLKEAVNKLRGEWGDTYDANVELGQMVINKFSADKEQEDYLTTTLTKDPRGIKFLAKIGNQFSENKIGEFSYKRFSLTPEQAQTEIDAIIADPNHPYNDAKAPEDARNRAIDYVNGLYASIEKARQGQAA